MHTYITYLHTYTHTRRDSLGALAQAIRDYEGGMCTHNVYMYACICLCTYYSHYVHI